ncbi:MAG: calcium/sodium antiporter [Spirochaetaceae bacterium]|jgi:cation:H+ antiporter|nr:calcium/sodium antiporter [Spirochaetaceae bacterium]
MIFLILAIVMGLVLLVWSADRFVEGASSTAFYLGMPPLLIGMVVVGFGTSAPEMLVSSIAALEGNPGIAIGNAYGSNIANIALILGVTSLIKPIIVHSSILKKELPILVCITGLSAILILDYEISIYDAGILLVTFITLMFWIIKQGLKKNKNSELRVIVSEIIPNPLSLKVSLFWLLAGLAILILSSRILVWGAVGIAKRLGVSDIIIGLTIVAVGTSLPELASSIIAVRKGKHDIALGNILGSNLFNTLAVVGIAGIIKPFHVVPEVLSRDVTLMGILTVSLFFICYGFKGKPGRINRIEGFVLLSVYIGYIIYLMISVFGLNTHNI